MAKVIFTEQEIDEQEKALTTEERLRYTISHEVGHTIIGMLHGIIPTMVLVSHKGTHGINEYNGWNYNHFDKDGYWDFHLGGYWATKTFCEYEDKSFYRTSNGNYTSDWDKCGNLSKAKIDRTCELITKEIDRLWLPVNEAYDRLTETLWHDGVIYNSTLHDVFNEFFDENEDDNLKSWADYENWWSRYHHTNRVAK